MFSVLYVITFGFIDSCFGAGVTGFWSRCVFRADTCATDCAPQVPGMHFAWSRSPAQNLTCAKKDRDLRHGASHEVRQGVSHGVQDRVRQGVRHGAHGMRGTARIGPV